MPKLPKGMFRRGRSFYTRLRSGGADRWVSLGIDFDDARRRLREIQAGTLTPSGRKTVREAAYEWVETYVRTARSAQNVALAKRRVRMYLEEFLGFKLVGRVTPQDLRQYRLWIQSKGKSPQTVAHILSDARCFFNWCESTGYVGRSPFPPRLMPRIQERPPDRLTDDEVDAILRVSTPCAFVVRLALATGLRWGELCRSQASHVERGMLVVSQTKSGRVRRVPLPADLLQEIRNRVGRLVPYSERSSGSFARQVREHSGVGRFHVHQLRHTFACQWLERGGSLAALQQILGHASIETTQRYARLTDDHVRAEAERINRVG
jgi:integrase